MNNLLISDAGGWIICVVVSVLVAALIVGIIVYNVRSFKREKKLKDGFSKLYEGMTEKQVIDLLGNPNERTPQSLEWSFYTRWQGASGKFTMSVVITDDKVTSFSLIKPNKVKVKKVKSAEKPIKETFIIDVSTNKSLSGALLRDAVFGLPGVIAQNGNRKFLFLIVYEDGTKKTEDVKKDTKRFQQLIQYLQLN